MHVEEPEELVTYLGRSVPRRGFRAYIFHTDGRKRIVEGFDEFEMFTHSDEWFATPEEAQGDQEVATEAPKKKSKKTGA